MRNSIEIKNLYKSFGEVKAVQDLSFCVKEGELFAFLGVNGAGKSTTINILCGQLQKDSGKVFVDGTDLDDDSAFAKQSIGVVFQSSVLDGALSVYDNLRCRSALYGIVGEAFEKRLSELAEMLDFKDLLKRSVAKLSGGQKRRIDIARALLHHPKILILDEPTAGQDYHHYTEIMEFLKSLNEQGVTIVMITHDMHLMLEYTPHAIVIHGGEKIGDASAAWILTNEEIANKASLKITSLYELAQKAGVANPTGFVQNFIDYERGHNHA